MLNQEYEVFNALDKGRGEQDGFCDDNCGFPAMLTSISQGLLLNQKQTHYVNNTSTGCRKIERATVETLFIGKEKKPWLGAQGLRWY